MIVYTKQGKRIPLPALYSYQGGVFLYPFTGDVSYTDPFDSENWYWGGVSPTEYYGEIIGVTQYTEPLIPSASISDCEALEGSFFWDGTMDTLYVHWYDSPHDIAVDRARTSLYQLVAGYATGYNRLTRNVFDGVFYAPIMTGLSGLDKKADPLKLGLIAFNESSFTVSNQEGLLDELEATEVVGVPVWFYVLDETDTALTDVKRAFTGIMAGYSNNRESITFQVVENRFADNTPVCPNQLSADDYPSAGSLAGKLIPTAWGQIRRGLMILTNIDDLTTASSGSATFIVADTSLAVIRAITAVYDSEDNSITIDSYDLTAGTVTVTKPADVSPTDLKKWKWEGQGYDIDGDYNNGLDIIRAAYLYLASTPYLDTTFDTATWAAETLNNPQPVGLSIQSDKGFIEEIIEPIATSLQGGVDILGDGRISFAARNTSADVADVLAISDQFEEPTITVSPKETVSEIVIEYSPDFPAKESLQALYSAEAENVILNYAINRRDPVSPVKTVLVNESDALALGEEIMDTSGAPVRTISSKNIKFIDAGLFDIVAIDTGKFSESFWEFGEVLSIVPDYITKQQTIIVRIIPDYAVLIGDTNNNILIALGDSLWQAGE